MVESITTAAAGLRADARRNVEQIRAVAADLFRERGFAVPLEEIAERAGVSKGTIYHRFGSREGLVADLVDELVGECVGHVLDEARAAATPRERLEVYLRGMWMIQYNEPAANDVLIRVEHGSTSSSVLCARAREAIGSLLANAQADEAVRGEITADDIYQLILERGHALRAGHRPAHADYERQIDFTLRALRP